MFSLQKKVSDEDSADYTVRSYRITIPGGANSDSIIVKSKVPTFQKLAELESAGQLDGPITFNDFGEHSDADQLHLRMGELIREAIATNLKIGSKAKATNLKIDSKATATNLKIGSKVKAKSIKKMTTRRPADVDAIIKARSFVASADDESVDRTPATLADRKEHLQKLITLLADSGQPTKQPTKDRLAKPTAADRVRGPIVVGDDTEEKNRSDQVEEDSSPTPAVGEAFEMDEQKYRDLLMLMQMVVEKTDKAAEAGEGANSSGGAEKDEL